MEAIEKIMHEQFQRRSFKYKLFFTGLLFEKYIFRIDGLKQAEERAKLLRNYYFLMRYLDDIVDGDVNIPGIESLEDRIGYLKDKLLNIETGNNHKDNVDKMLDECHFLANNLGFSMEEESKLIIQSLIFDGNRMLSLDRNCQLCIVSQQELTAHFYDLDILGTISGCLKIYDEPLSYLDILYPLGVASRQYYDIRDFMEDIKRGLINISKENMVKHGISIEQLEELIALEDSVVDVCKKHGYTDSRLYSKLPSSIIEFLNECIDICNSNIQRYHQKYEHSNERSLRSSTQITLLLGYEKPIKSYVKKIKHSR